MTDRTAHAVGVAAIAVAALLARTAIAAVAGEPATAGAAAAPDEPAAGRSAAIRAERVAFPSLDAAKTELVGFLFAPPSPAPRAPAVVLMHGRSGAYSSAAQGVYTAETLSLRHRFWARYWAERGYYALLVDGFGPRGYPGGFPRGSYDRRPESLDEVTIRPLDAYGALAYLRTRPEIDGARIGLMGWSNGGSATLAAMADDKGPGIRELGFRAALSFYPGCGLKGRFDASGYRPYAPVQVFMGSKDEEVAPERCMELIRRSKRHGAEIDLTLYRGATHSFDDPGRRRQSVAANAKATADVRAKAAAFFERHLAPARP